MLKHMLIIGAAAVSVPAFAQETPPADPAAPPPTEQPDPSATAPTSCSSTTSWSRKHVVRRRARRRKSQDHVAFGQGPFEALPLSARRVPNRQASAQR